MSFVHCVIVRGGRIMLRAAHWRSVKRWLDADFPEFDEVPVFADDGVLDAGYMLIDYDQKLVVSCQDAFTVPECGRKSRVFQEL